METRLNAPRNSELFREQDSQTGRSYIFKCIVAKKSTKTILNGIDKEAPPIIKPQNSLLLRQCISAKDIYKPRYQTHTLNHFCVHKTTRHLSKTTIKSQNMNFSDFIHHRPVNLKQAKHIQKLQIAKCPLKFETHRNSAVPVSQCILQNKIQFLNSFYQCTPQCNIKKFSHLSRNGNSSKTHRPNTQLNAYKPKVSNINDKAEMYNKLKEYVTYKGEILYARQIDDI
jgi:hypothetical protein